MKKLLDFILTGLVEKPKKVKIKESSGGGEEIFTIQVDPADMGRVIGKKGQVIKAVRTLLRTAAAKKGRKVQVILADSVVSGKK